MRMEEDIPEGYALSWIALTDSRRNNSSYADRDFG